MNTDLTREVKRALTPVLSLRIFRNVYRVSIFPESGLCGLYCRKSQPLADLLKATTDLSSGLCGQSGLRACKTSVKAVLLPSCEQSAELW